MGFKRVHLSRRHLILVREEEDGHRIASIVLSPAQEGNDATSLYGRGALRRIHLNPGNDAIVRTYYHGGLFRRVTGGLFFTWPARPFRELVITEQARERGIPTVEILAAVVERCWGPFYRGWLVSRELGGAEDLWTALQKGPQFRVRVALLQAAAMSIRHMHREGVSHADLNLKNILVRGERDEFRAYLIDFDKARLFPQGVPAHRAKRNLRRLLRSARKLDPQRQHISREDWAAFMAFYEQGQ